MKRFVIAGTSFFLGVVILITLAIREGGIPTVAAADLLSGKYPGDQVFMDGEVTEILEDGVPARFRFLDKRGGSQALLVETRVVLSDTFTVGSALRVKGSYDPDARLFTASYIDTKCPSKYEGAEGGGATYGAPAAGSPTGSGGAE